MPTERQVTIVLAYLVVFDATLVTWAFGFPDLWFEVWHGEVYDDPAALLTRCGANWAGFLVCQILAFLRWRENRHWLAVIAGVRLSDIFTDVTTALVAEEVTTAGMVLLPAGSLMNVGLGLWLLWAHRVLREP